MQSISLFTNTTIVHFPEKCIDMTKKKLCWLHTEEIQQFSWRFANWYIRHIRSECEIINKPNELRQSICVVDDYSIFIQTPLRQTSDWCEIVEAKSVWISHIECNQRLLRLLCIIVISLWYSRTFSFSFCVCVCTSTHTHTCVHTDTGALDLLSARIDSIHRYLMDCSVAVSLLFMPICIRWYACARDCVCVCVWVAKWYGNDSWMRRKSSKKNRCSRFKDFSANARDQHSRGTLPRIFSMFTFFQCG